MFLLPSNLMNGKWGIEVSIDYMIDLLKKFVSIDTTSTERKNYDKITELIKEEAKKIGCNVEKVVDEKGIPHLKITLPNAPVDRKKVIFLTHYDVVPPGEGWSFDPFKPFVKDGKVYGRGVSDDKSSIAAALTAFKEMLEEKLEPKIYPVLIVSGGEETGESEEFYKSITGDIGVVLDSGPEGLSIGASGIARVTVLVKGEQAHSAYPFKGKNAIYLAAKIVSFVEKLGKELEKTVVSKHEAPEYYEKLPARANVTIIESGVAPNIIPGECKLIIDRRTIPEEKAEDAALDLKRKIEEFAKENNIEVKIDAKGLMDSWVTTDEEVIEKFKHILKEVTGEEPKTIVELGGTDGVHLIDRMPVIQFGALRGDNNIHGLNEFVYIKDLTLVKEFVKKTILTPL